MPTWDASGAGYGAIGGATSAVVAPLVRDGLYHGSQTVTTTDNGDGTQTVTTSYDNRVYNAATVAIAMLAGGGLAAALGRDANAAAGAAQNEALLICRSLLQTHWPDYAASEKYLKDSRS